MGIEEKYWYISPCFTSTVDDVHFYTYLRSKDGASKKQKFRSYPGRRKRIPKQLEFEISNNTFKYLYGTLALSAYWNQLTLN